MEAFFVSLPSTTRRTRWLQSNNRYRINCVGRYKKDLKAPIHVINKQLINYVSASAPTHVIDAWSFLGRALSAALQGDANSAIHFAYYCELRSAMSLLGAEGIGVLADKHPILDKSGATNCFKGFGTGGGRKLGTHSFVWPALSHWAGLKRAANLFDDLVSPNGMPLSTWISSVSPGSSAAAVAESWLISWGIDLSILDDDHDLRNESSYRPSEFRATEIPIATDALDLAVELWKLFEPGAGSRFPALERSLLRRGIRMSINRPMTLQDMAAAGIYGADAQRWVGFLNDPQDPLPIQLASTRSSMSSATCHLEVISRAALLLALATSNCRRMLTNADFTTQDLQFWWQKHGAIRGLWDPSDMPIDPIDQWADIDAAINETKDWVNLTGRTNVSFWQSRKNLPSQLSSLGSMELAGIWGLLP